eukprot:330997-Prorocentrum_minimum.AAC.1
MWGVGVPPFTVLLADRRAHALRPGLGRETDPMAASRGGSLPEGSDFQLPPPLRQFGTLRHPLRQPRPPPPLRGPLRARR